LRIASEGHRILIGSPAAQSATFLGRKKWIRMDLELSKTAPHHIQKLAGKEPQRILGNIKSSQMFERSQCRRKLRKPNIPEAQNGEMLDV
jgi:hypothetical protein